MNLPEYSLRNRKVVWFLLLVLLLGGAASFVSLEKKEDALFVIKSAMLVCSYPGATPRQVEQLVTEPIEREVQGMRAVHKVTSESGYGRSKILVELDPATRASEIPQLWTNCADGCSTCSRRCPTVSRKSALPTTSATSTASITGSRPTRAFRGRSCASGPSASSANW